MKCEVQFRTKVGWYLLWDNGWTSSMPDEKTAWEMAAAPDVLAALEALLNSAIRHRWKVNSNEPDTINAAMDLLAKIGKDSA